MLPLNKVLQAAFCRRSQGWRMLRHCRANSRERRAAASSTGSPQSAPFCVSCSAGLEAEIGRLGTAKHMGIPQAGSPASRDGFENNARGLTGPARRLTGSSALTCSLTQASPLALRVAMCCDAAHRVAGRAQGEKSELAHLEDPQKGSSQASRPFSLSALTLRIPSPFRCACGAHLPGEQTPGRAGRSDAKGIAVHGRQQGKTGTKPLAEAQPNELHAPHPRQPEP